MKKDSTYRKLLRFAINGARAWRLSSSGKYQTSSPEIIEMRKEVMEAGDGFAEDRRNLFQDRVNVSADVKKSFKKIKMATING